MASKAGSVSPRCGPEKIGVAIHEEEIARTLHMAEPFGNFTRFCGSIEAAGTRGGVKGDGDGALRGSDCTRIVDVRREESIHTFSCTREYIAAPGNSRFEIYDAALLR